MQENVKIINEFFPERTVTVNEQAAKIHVQLLTDSDILNLAKISDQCRTINVKRSGTGLTIIFKF